MWSKLWAALVQLVAGLIRSLPGPGHGPTPSPVPSDAPAPAEGEQTPGPGGDEIDPRLIAWDEPRSPAVWPITAHLVGVRIDGHRIQAMRVPPRTWAAVQERGWTKPAVGNWWIFRRINGIWHGVTREWLGVDAVSVDLPTGGEDDIHGPLGDLPAVYPGEQIGVMQSSFGGRDGNARGTAAQRTQIVLVRMP